MSLGFTPIHLKTPGCVSSASLPKPCLRQLLLIISDMLTTSVTSREEVLHEEAWDAMFLFPTLVLEPQKSGAASSLVKA